MKNWYSYIMFYRYPGESITRAFAFNDKRQLLAALNYGAIVIEVTKATSRARALCTEVNTYPHGMPQAVLKMKIEETKFGEIRVEDWKQWLTEL